MEDATPASAPAHAPRIATSLREETIRGLTSIDAWMGAHWELHYDRPELLRLLTQIVIQLIHQEQVHRPGVRFAVLVPRGAKRVPLTPVTGPARARPTSIWVGGLTVVGLEWIQSWLAVAGSPASWSEVLEVVVDLALQALQAGLVERPIGPYVRVSPPAEALPT